MQGLQVGKGIGSVRHSRVGELLTQSHESGYADKLPVVSSGSCCLDSRGAS